jgi:hypothetical protein
MDQPAAFGAASKTLKTTVLIDLSVALVTKTDWLGHFKIPKRRNVLLITGESNNRATMRRIDRAARARGLSVSDLKTLYIETVNFPKLPSVDDREMLRRTVAEKQIDIVIVDPLYRGLGNLDTNRLAEMADSIVQFAKAAQPAATIIAHHIIKSAAKLKNGKVPALEDMSGAGLAESVGQWWLVGRNEEYKHDRRHDLGVQYGGRDEQCGSLRILVQEDDWTFDIESMGDYRNAKKEAREKAKAENLELEVTDTMGAISQLLKTETVAKPKSFIESQSGKSVAITRKALSRMILEGDVVQQKYGNRNGWILKCNAQ